MAKRSLVRVLEVGLAVAYGAIVGSWVPVPTPQSIYVLPTAVVTATLPAGPAVPALPVGTDASVRILPVAWTASAPAHSAVGTRDLGPARGTDPPLDTLPAAPRFAVVPFAGGATGPGPRELRGPIGGGTALSYRDKASGCAAIVAEGEPLPPSCRRRSAPSIRSACPSPGERTHGRPMICIRAED